MNNDTEITLLSAEEIWGDESNNGKLEALNKYSSFAAVTDLVVLTGGFTGHGTYTGVFYTKSLAGINAYVTCVNEGGSRGWIPIDQRTGTIRPVLLSPSAFYQIIKNKVNRYNGIYEVEYGEYPQYAPDKDMQNILESEYQKGNLRITGRDYTFDRTKHDDYEQSFQPVKYEEYEYKRKRYIRIKVTLRHDGIIRQDGSEYKLSNGVKYRDGDYVWIEVSPVVWLVDYEAKELVSKCGLLSGIRFNGKKYDGIFENTEMYRYLHEHMLRDLLQKNNAIEHAEIDSISDGEYKELESKIKELPKELQEEYLIELKSLIEEMNNSEPKKK